MTHEQLISFSFLWHWNLFPDERRMLYSVNNNISEGLLKWVPRALKQQAAKEEGNRNKRKGVVAGVYDFCYMPPGGGIPVAYLDAKVGNDKLSDEQLDFREKCHKRGIPCFTFSTLEEFQIIINKLRNGS